jgi:hypothetical protein
MREASFESRRRKWAAIAAKGKTHYVVVRGVLGFGIATTVFTLIWDRIRDPSTSGLHNLSLEFLFRVPFYLLGGYLFGLVTWKWFSWRYGAADSQQLPGPPLGSDH